MTPRVPPRRGTATQVGEGLQEQSLRYSDHATSLAHTGVSYGEQPHLANGKISPWCCTSPQLARLGSLFSAANSTFGTKETTDRSRGISWRHKSWVN